MTYPQSTPDLKDIKIMGIINVTPDSFSDGGDYNTLDATVERASKLLDEGADILDIGGESTRPGAPELSAAEELERVIPAIQAIHTAFPQAILSIDTYKAEVAHHACQNGATIINDVWGLQREPEIADVAAKFDCQVIINHWDNTESASDQVENINIIEGLEAFFKRSLQITKDAGIHDNRVILDPGIGFGKSFDDNLVILNRLDQLMSLGYPLLLGTSRKRFIGEILNKEPKDRVFGTLATNIVGLSKGVDIIRVHDVSAHKDALRILQAIAQETMP